MAPSTSPSVPESSPSSPLRRLSTPLLALLALALPVTGGVLTYYELFVDGINADGLGGAGAATVSPDGLHVYATGAADNGIAVFRRDASANTLAFIRAIRDGQNGVFGLQGASAIAASSDGRAVAATGRFDDTVLLFRRDVTNNNLILTDVDQHGVGGVFGMGAPTAVVFGSDQQRVYVAAYDSDAVAVFRRDVSQDALTFVEAQVGVEGLAGPASLAVSGEYLFVAARDSHMVVMFRRNAPSDHLIWVHSFALPVGCEPTSIVNVPAGHPQLPANQLWVACPGTGTLQALSWQPSGLSGGASIAIAAAQPGGNWGLRQTSGPLFLAGPDGQRLLVFSRSGNNFAKVEDLDAAAIPALAGARAVAAMPNGQSVWVVSFDSSALLSFENPEFSDGFESGSTATWSATFGN